MSCSTQLTREIVRQELAGRVLADLLRFNTVLGSTAGHRALGLEAPAVPSHIEPTLSASPHELTLSDIDVDQLPIGRVVMAMFDYATAQRFPVGVSLCEFKEQMEHVEDFATSLRSSILELFMSDNQLMGEAASANFEALPLLHALANARLNLDTGESLNLSDLALLADMEERSVRNALTATGEGRLSIQASPSGHEWVDNDEARRWLALRRGFKPTNFQTVNFKPDEHPPALHSLYELGTYVYQRWTALGKTPESVLKELYWSESRFDYLNAIAAQPHRIDPRDCRDLARSLMVSEAWFTRQVLGALYPEQVSLLLQGQGPQAQQAASAPALDKERFCGRLKFVLHDGTELFPVRMKSRDSGKVAFRLTAAGTAGNTKDTIEEVEAENQMIELVCKQNRAIRLYSADSSRQGIYRRTGRSVRFVELDGTVV
jgi:hypothetical protein